VRVFEPLVDLRRGAIAFPRSSTDTLVGFVRRVGIGVRFMRGLNVGVGVGELKRFDRLANLRRLLIEPLVSVEEILVLWNLNLVGAAGLLDLDRVDVDCLCPREMRALERRLIGRVRVVAADRPLVLQRDLAKSFRGEAIENVPLGRARLEDVTFVGDRLVRHTVATTI
jgi:hypothetical protein